MFICNQENLTKLLLSCEKGATKVAAIVTRDIGQFNDYKSQFIESFYGGGIYGAKSVKQAFDINDTDEVDCVEFENGSLIFLYARPDAREIPYNQTMICGKEDHLFDLELISESALQLEITEELHRAIEFQDKKSLLSLEEARKLFRKQNDEETKADPLDEWMDSLKVIS